jgi:hypothetical protein
MVSDTVQVNLRGLLFALVVVIVVVIFGIGALTNDDPLWFLPVFNETPKQIVVYKAGCSVELSKGQPGFDEMTNAINQTLPQFDGFNSSFGLSQESLKEHREKESLVEVFYAKPVTVHTPYRFGHPDSILIPLSGYFAEARAIFGGKAGEYWAGALRLKSIEPIRRTAEQVQCSQ